MWLNRLRLDVNKQNCLKSASCFFHSTFCCIISPRSHKLWIESLEQPYPCQTKIAQQLHTRRIPNVYQMRYGLYYSSQNTQCVSNVLWFMLQLTGYPMCIKCVMVYITAHTLILLNVLRPLFCALTLG